jgi:hypothetical protein
VYEPKALHRLDEVIRTGVTPHGVDLPYVTPYGGNSPMDFPSLHSLHERYAGRLGELEKLGLAKRLDADRWQVAPDLVAAVEAKGVTEQRPALSIERMALRSEEQVRHLGPAWLDQVDLSTLAPWGFGAELRVVVNKRNKLLRVHGIDPADPRKLEALRELEHRAAERNVTPNARQPNETQVAERLIAPKPNVPAEKQPEGARAPVVGASEREKLAAAREQARLALGRQIAAGGTYQFLEKAPERFSGWVQARGKAPGSDIVYAQITDGVRFVLVPMTPELQKMVSHKVSLMRDVEGHLRMKAPERDRGR